MPEKPDIKDVETKATETKSEAEKKPDFDKDRQRADQAEANLRKEKNRREQLENELTSLRTTAELLQSQVVELSKSKKDADELSDQLPDIPDDASTEDLARAHKAMNKLIKNLFKTVGELRQSTSRHQQETRAEREQREAAEHRNATLDKVCTRLEKKHGAGLRNRAIALMEKRIEDGEQPGDPTEATLMLDDCFEQAKIEREDKKKQDKDKPNDDTGGGGTRPRLGPAKLKPGSLDEVAAQFETAATG